MKKQERNTVTNYDNAKTCSELIGQLQKLKSIFPGVVVNLILWDRVFFICQVWFFFLRI